MMSDMAGDAEPGTTIQCRELVELVTDYLEGALDDDTRIELEAHLELCPPCADFVRQMQITLQTTGSVPLDDFSAEAKAEVLAAFRDYRATPR